MNQNSILSSKGTISSGILLLVILYSEQLQPKIPNRLKYLFTLTLTRIALISSALTIFNGQPAKSLIMVTTTLMIFKYIENYTENFSIMVPDPRSLNVDFNCEEATYEDILGVFKGDVAKLKIYAADRGLLNQDVRQQAPLIASFMVNDGIAVTKKCNRPYR